MVAAYSRPLSLARILRSLNKADYGSCGVKVLVSIDGGGSEDVVDTAENFEFYAGEYEVIVHKENMGLRRHIIWCGDQSIKYGSVVVLEDDVFVDPQFYIYAVSALQEYGADDRVSGIALYSPTFNQASSLPFIPAYNGSSVYFAALPCSWGQAWTSVQWCRFRDWYGDGERSKVDGCYGLPSRVKSWPESSWKKYFAAYMVERCKYFVYPYRSYATNCSDDGGTHVEKKTNFYHVPMAEATRLFDELRFFGLASEQAVIYDAYMDRSADYFAALLKIQADDLVVDLYGVKPRCEILKKRYAITVRRVSAAIAGYDLSFKPVELNVYFEEEGSAISFALSENVVFEDRSYLFGLFLYWCNLPILSRKYAVLFVKEMVIRLGSKLFGTNK